ncbi:MAG: ATP-binding protein [Anaerolineae bacterium]
MSQRMPHQLQRQKRELKAVSDIARAVNRSLDLRSTLEAGIRESLKIVGGEAGCILLLEGKPPRWMMAAWQGVDQGLLRRLEEAMGGDESWPAAEGPWSDVFALQSLSEGIKKAMRGAGFNSFNVLPLQSKVGVLGMTVLASREERLLGLQSIEALMTIAEQLGTAIENARLYKAMAEEKHKLEAILNSIADGVYTTDRERRITTFNPALEAMTGWRAEEVLGQFCGDVFHAQDEAGRSLCGPDEGCGIYWALQQGCPIFSWGQKRFITTKDGRRIPISKIASPLWDNTGQVVGAVAAFWDASRDMELEHLKDEFLSLVSHELRAPLTNIKAAAQLGLRRLDTRDRATLQEVLEIICEQCDRLIGFTEKMLRISHMKAGRLTVERRPFALLPLIGRAIALYRVGAPHCRFEVWARGNPWAMGDEEQVTVILNALLDNAVKYSPPGGTIRVEATEDHEEVVLVSVTDQGPGIPARELGRVFDRFYRGRRQGAGGHGLGLYLAKMLVEAQGGRIWIESDVGKGTRVYFTLPRV